MEKMRYPVGVDLNGLCEMDAREFSEGRHYDGLTPITVALYVDGRAAAPVHVRRREYAGR